MKRVQAVSSSSRAANLNLSEMQPREVLAIRVRALEEAAEKEQEKGGNGNTVLHQIVDKTENR